MFPRRQILFHWGVQVDALDTDARRNARNKNETLSQNYRRLGLTAKLGKATGGIEYIPSSSSAPARPKQDPLAVTPSSGYRSAIQSVKVERDADGNIIKVLHKDNPLNDPLNDLDDDDEDEDSQTETTGSGAGGSTTTTTKKKKINYGTRVVDLLEMEANLPTEKHVRHQSAREREWLEKLIAKHGDDTGAMARDLKLNPMQQTAAELRKRLKAYHGEK